jgi:hypothetical protein
MISAVFYDLLVTFTVYKRPHVLCLSVAEILMSFMFTVYNGFIFVYLFYSYVPISITREGDIFLPCFDYTDVMLRKHY